MKNGSKRLWQRIALPVTFLVLIFAGCAGLKDLTKVQQPKVSLADVRIAGLSFDAIDLLFDIEVENPNVVGVTMAGFDYNFFLNQQSFVKGNQPKRQNIAGNGSSTVEFPLTLRFSDLYSTYNSLKNDDSTSYQIDLGFQFDLPVLGVVRVPVSRQGAVPLLKLPRVALGGIKVNKMGLTAAELLVNVEVDNPNAFSMLLNRLNYSVELSGSQVASGVTDRDMRIGEKGSSTLSIPISLSFLDAGQSLYSLLTKQGKLDYRLIGDVDLSTSVPMLGQVTLPFDRSGEVTLNR